MATLEPGSDRGNRIEVRAGPEESINPAVTARGPVVVSTKRDVLGRMTFKKIHFFDPRTKKTVQMLRNTKWEILDLFEIRCCNYRVDLRGFDLRPGILVTFPGILPATVQWDIAQLLGEVTPMVSRPRLEIQRPLGAGAFRVRCSSMPPEGYVNLAA